MGRIMLSELIRRGVLPPIPDIRVPPLRSE
jgi:hypothetical protein